MLGIFSRVGQELTLPVQDLLLAPQAESLLPRCWALLTSPRQFQHLLPEELLRAGFPAMVTLMQTVQLSGLVLLAQR